MGFNLSILVTDFDLHLGFDSQCGYREMPKDLASFSLEYCKVIKLRTTYNKDASLLDCNDIQTALYLLKTRGHKYLILLWLAGPCHNICMVLLDFNLPLRIFGVPYVVNFRFVVYRKGNPAWK